MKSKSKTKSTETLAPSTFSQPFINDAAATLKPAYEQSQGLLNQYLPQTQKGVDYYTDTMDGKFLGGNEYMDSMIDDSNQSIADSVNSQFSGARFGSGYHTRALADRIGQNENNIRFGQYNTERGYQNDAALRRQGLIESTVGMPQGAAGGYANNVNSLLGRYATSTGSSSTTSKMSIAQLIGQMSQAAASAAAASEPALKTNVVKVGAFEDGLGIYDFDYLPIEGRIAGYMPAGRQRGVMADEVEALRPWALGPVIEGYRTVNYAALGAN